jgi:large subunit ribosomal protein L18
MKNKRELMRIKRHNKIKMRMHGTSEKPRLVVHRSLKHFSAALVDDSKNISILSLSTLDKEIRQQFKTCGSVKSAQVLGQAYANKLKEKGVTKIIFDRAGYLYHGRIKAFAEALRKGGLEF